MQKRTLGKSNLEVSAIGLGCMTLFRILFLTVVLVTLFSGCATDEGSQSGASPTVSGSVSVGGGKNF